MYGIVVFQRDPVLLDCAKFIERIIERCQDFFLYTLLKTVRRLDCRYGGSSFFLGCDFVNDILRCIHCHM